MQALIVREAFSVYKKGSMITDPAEMKRIRESGDTVHVMLTTVPDPATPDPVADKPSAKA